MNNEYKVGQKVAIRIRPGSNPYRMLAKDESPIFETEVITVGRKYITVKNRRDYLENIKIPKSTNNRIPASYDYELYPDINTANDAIKVLEEVKQISTRISSLQRYNYTDISYEDAIAINKILDKYFSN